MSFGPQATWPFSSVFVVAYSTILLAELVGDKTVYTVTSITLRFPAGVVFAAVTMAFAGKMLAAVLLAKVSIHAPLRWTAMVSAAALFTSALFIWFKKCGPRPSESSATTGWARATAISFASIFFNEWGDPGQIAAAGLAAQSHAWLAIWLGGTLALMTKAGLAMTVGLKLREWLPDRALRTLAAGSCCVLGFLALRGVLFP